MWISVNARQYKDRVYETLARMGRGLGNAHRLELLDLLAQAPRSVDELARGTDRPVANTSQHLQVLRRAGLVQSQRRGSRSIYSLAPAAGPVLALLRGLADRQLAELAHARRAYDALHPGVQDISSVEVAAGLLSGALLLIDVRSPDEYAHGHIAGARNLPLDLLDASLDDLPHDVEIVACCRGPWCSYAVVAVEHLLAAGFRARRFDFGVDDWRLVGGQVETGPAR